MVWVKPEEGTYDKDLLAELDRNRPTPKPLG